VPSRAWWLFSLLIHCVAAIAQGAAAPPPAELFFRPPEVLAARLSPSGTRLAVTTTLGAERVGLYVWESLRPGEAQPGTRPGRFTRAAIFNDVDVGRFEWVNDEQLVFEVLDLSEGGAKQDPPGLIAVRHDGSTMRALIARRGWGGPTRRGVPTLAANHRLLLVPAAAGDEVIVGEWISDGVELLGIRPKWLNVNSGATRDASAGGPSRATHWHFDSRGEARVAQVVVDKRRRLYWRGSEQPRWQLFDDSDVLAPRFSPAFVDDGGTLYVTRTEGPAEAAVLARFDFAQGRPQAEPVVTVPGFDFTGTPVFSDRPGGPPLLGLQVEAETLTAVWFDERLKQLQREADQRLPGYVNQLTCRRCGAPDMVVLVHAYSDRDPGHFWLYQAQPPPAADGKAGPQWLLVSRVRREVDPAGMASIAFERIAARDGRALPLWLTFPPGRKPGDRGPAVVLVHGGPWLRGGHWRWSAMEQFLASRGYLVISPEFRGSAGYGNAHFRAGLKQWGQAMQDDVADAARWAIDKGLADRLCIAGASYGGYSTLMGLVRDPALYRCGVAWAAVADLLLLLEGSWWVDDDQSRISRGHTNPRWIGDVEKDAQMLKSASPVLQAHRIRAPLLLAYGERDRRVPIEHGRRLRRAMEDAGNGPEWVSYANEGHSWLKTASHVDFAQRVEAFLDKHLKPEAPPPR
jgi:acetyl esterase/lipase